MFTPVTCLSPHICRNKTDLGLGIGYLYSNVLKNMTYFVKHSTSFLLYYCAFQKHADSNAKFNQQNECFFCCRQSNVRRLFPASDYCRSCGNQIIEHSSDNEAVNGSSRDIWLTVAKNAFDGCVIERRSNQCDNCCSSLQTLVFSLEPDEDPLGVLLMIDFYALQSEQFSFLIRLFEEWEVWIQYGHSNFEHLTF